MLGMLGSGSITRNVRSEIKAAVGVVEPYARAVIGLLTIIAGSLVLIALAIWGGAGR